jgi:hypothetical protein
MRVGLAVLEGAFADCGRHDAGSINAVLLATPCPS